MAGQQLPFDLETEQAAIDRKRQLAQALMQQAFNQPQGQMVSGHFVAPGILQALAPVAAAFLGSGINSQADDSTKELKGKYNNMLASGLQKYFDADPRRAAIEALTSGVAPLQQLGLLDLQQIGKSALTPKDLLGLPGFDPKSRLLAAMGGGLGVLAPEKKEHVVNGQIVVGTPDSGYSPIADVRDTFGEVGVIGQGDDGKPIYGQKNTSTGEAKFAPKGVQVNVDTVQKAGDKFATELAGKRADLLAKSYDNATAASKAIDAIENAENDVSAGIKSGATGQVALGIAKFAKSLGLDADPQIANTEAFRANMARETLNLVKGLGAGTGISNADREFAEKASGGSILLDDQAIVRLMNIAKAAAGNVLYSHNRLLSAQQGATGTLPQDLETFRVPFTMKGNDQLVFDEGSKKFLVRPPAQPPKTVAPATTGKTAPGTISVQEWLSK